MNSESLGHYFFGQSKSERQGKIVSNTSHQVSAEARCSKGVCEVSWKPEQATITSQSGEADLTSALVKD